jgi:hypothetical protein
MKLPVLHTAATIAASGAILLALLQPSPCAAEPRVFPTGTTIYEPARAFNSFVMFAGTDGKSHLIDMDGNEVHQWDHFGFPGEVLDPATVHGERGHVLVQLEHGPGNWGGIFNNKSVGELDWDGKVVWEWGQQAPGGAARQNHDWHRLPNGNTLLIVTLLHTVPALSPKPIGDQALYEVTPSGDIVWRWVASDHLAEFGLSPAGLGYLRRTIARSVGVSDGVFTLNNMKVVGPNHWFEAGDRRFNPDNIIIDSRDANFIAIIDKSSGKIVWRLGPDYSGAHDSPHSRLLQSRLPRPVDQISGQHDAQIIPEGLPGAGNLLVFDNQGGAGFPPAALGIFSASRVLEIDPIKRQILWQYTGASSDRPVWTFHSSFISSARRLPNGNTLIDEGMNGRLFQVTPAGEIVWEYVSPYFAHASLRDQSVYSNWVYRAQPVPYDWIPAGTPHGERAVAELDPSQFHVPASPATAD